MKLSSLLVVSALVTGVLTSAAVFAEEAAPPAKQEIRQVTREIRQEKEAPRAEEKRRAMKQELRKEQAAGTEVKE